MIIIKVFIFYPICITFKPPSTEEDYDQIVKMYQQTQKIVIKIYSIIIFIFRRRLRRERGGSERSSAPEADGNQASLQQCGHG